jgi:NAD(P)-dependent dehydrogenase (short-subunit alcohol dehydrogenase family)
LRLPPRAAVRLRRIRATNAVMETTNTSVAGRVALVTGGGRGIGRAIALGLASMGARVAVLARSADELAATVAAAGQRGYAALALPADVNVPEQVWGAISVGADTWGSVEILVNNAAVVGPLGPSVEVDLEQWAAALAINVAAVARLSFALLPRMVDGGWGRIVNVSSSVAATPGGMPRANAYATTKAALEAHTLNLAAELTGTGVTANVFRPGGVDTEMQAWIRSQDPALVGAELHHQFVNRYQQGRLLTPEQSAASLLPRLGGVQSGQIWDASDPLPREEAIPSVRPASPVRRAR